MYKILYKYFYNSLYKMFYFCNKNNLLLVFFKNFLIVFTVIWNYRLGASLVTLRKAEMKPTYRL